MGCFTCSWCERRKKLDSWPLGSRSKDIERRKLEIERKGGGRLTRLGQTDQGWPSVDIRRGCSKHSGQRAALWAKALGMSPHSHDKDVVCLSWPYFASKDVKEYTLGLRQWRRVLTASITTPALRAISSKVWPYCHLWSSQIAYQNQTQKLQPLPKRKE